jgi:hypothetical protein
MRGRRQLWIDRIATLREDRQGGAAEQALVDAVDAGEVDQDRRPRAGIDRILDLDLGDPRTVRVVAIEDWLDRGDRTDANAVIGDRIPDLQPGDAVEADAEFALGVEGGGEEQDKGVTRPRPMKNSAPTFTSLDI